MRSARIVSTLLAGVMAAGCVAREIGGGGETGTGGGETGSGGATTSGGGDPTTPTSGGPTSSPPGTSSSPPDPSAGTMTGETGETGVGFIITPDHGGDDCDVFAQDCPEGQKCAPWASDGGNAWNATKCVDITGDQEPGEPCTTAGGGVSGEDDCIKGALCWDVDAEDHGTCIAMCTGSADEPVCEDENSWCAITDEGVINLCFPVCDPLVQDCPGDDLCLPIGDSFVCVLDASGDEGQAFDPCEYLNACDPGLLCAPSEVASECDPRSTGCCVPMCSISKMAPCPGVGQQCLSLYGEGMAPPKFEDVGFCTLPPL